ncbi:MAG: hypothetical protein ABIR18_15955, partial [Chitinophagaceae bacterium]
MNYLAPVKTNPHNMKMSRLLLLLPVLLITQYSCQKEGKFQDDLNSNGGSGGSGGSNQTLQGDYDFVGITTQSVTSVTVT